jgi:hypothetical protein
MAFMKLVYTIYLDLYLLVCLIDCQIDAGVNSVYNLGKVYSWNSMTTLSNKYWYGTEARMINGTDGSFQHLL